MPLPSASFNHSPASHQTHGRTGHGGSSQDMGLSISQQNGARKSPGAQLLSDQRAESTSTENRQNIGNRVDEVQQLQRYIARLKEKIELLKDLNRSYRIVNQDKSLECNSLQEKVDGMEKQIASANLLPALRRSQQLEDDELAKLRMKFARQKDFISSLQTENLKLHQQTKQQAQQMQAQITEFAHELDEAKRDTLVRVPKISDTEIQGEWKAIGCFIRQFVMNYLQGPLHSSAIEGLAQLEQFHWLPDIVRTLQSPVLRPIVMESWIWHFLCFRIFDSKSSVWAGKVGAAFSTPCEQIRVLLSRDPSSLNGPNVNVQQFHDWRVRSAHLITQFSTTDDWDSTIATTATEMLGILAVVTSPILSQGQVQDMHHDALNIVQRAAELDKIFRLSKADFHVFITRVKLPLVQPPSFNFRFDPETMERITTIPVPDPEPIVDLAVSPGILKSGNADGANYGSERVLVKLQALCNLKPVLDLFSVDEPGQETSIKREMEIKVELGFSKMEEAEGDDDVDTLKPEPEFMECRP